MKKLEKIWLDGKLVNWDDANVHILTHSLHYGLAAFEGERCYACEDGRSAIFRHKESTQSLTERSRFVRRDGQWYYLDGEYETETTRRETPKIGRNDPCPCGSGKKFKKCCGRQP